MSKAEWELAKVREGKVCAICKNPTKGQLRFKGRPLCGRCNITLQTLLDPEKRRRIVEDFD